VATTELPQSKRLKLRRAIIYREADNSSCHVSADNPSTAAAIWATSSSAREAGAPVNFARWIIDASSRTQARVPMRSW